ncbi:MAG: hypothetical protein JOZ22_22545 [Acidobacteriia bacterium]|nr:hypothetical protein [Terriglobia bacterium]
MRSWLARSLAVCGTISLLLSAAEAPASSAPAVVLVDAADLPQWRTWTESAGWQVIAPSGPANSGIDVRVEAIEAAALQAVRNNSVDRARLYLAGRGEAAAAVFYTISKTPDLWAAAVAVGGSPLPAIDTGRVYAANFSNVPVLWIGTRSEDQQLAAKLAENGLNLEWRNGDQLPLAAVLDWLGMHTRQEFPSAIDCETASASFSHCYWIRPMKFDAAERNDVLPSSRIEPTIKPALDLGGYGYKPEDPGPGILISFLPPKYSGPLKMGDRIIELAGRPLADAHAYDKLMSDFKEERQTAVIVQRGKERLRLETAVVFPKQAVGATARVQAQFDSAAREVQILSRAITEMQVTIPAAWTPSTLTWNGVPLEKLEPPQTGNTCVDLRIDKELETSAPCSK